MIKFFRINNIALISFVEIELQGGLTLLTGETGAGKSMLIDALGLALGSRATSDLIRTGEDSAAVEVIVEDAGLARELAARGLPSYPEETVIGREVTTSGRSRATVNGTLVPAGVLRELAPWVATIHGQHEHQGLLDTRTHLPLLDGYAGLPVLASEVAEAHRRHRETATRLARLAEDRRGEERRREMLEHQLREIEAAGLSSDEESRLRREREIQVNADRLALLLDEAYDSLHEAEGAAIGRLARVFDLVEQLARIDGEFASHAGGREDTLAPLEELAIALRDYRARLEGDPARLEEIEARLATIERLKHKYGSSAAEVLEFAESCRQQLDESGSHEERLEQLEKDRDRLARAYWEKASELSLKRRQTAPELARRVEQQLRGLAMEKARVSVRFSPEAQVADEADTDAWTERGLEDVEMLLAANQGEALRPLAKVASGGELSRVLLGLKSIASLDGDGSTLVFDEVDAGIGGRVAEVVGQRLKEMSSRHQVLCVTHLPQIASQADSHFVVRKATAKRRTLTEVSLIESADRVEEIARMLGGRRVTEAARRHAREMVRQAGEE